LSLITVHYAVCEPVPPPWDLSQPSKTRGQSEATARPDHGETDRLQGEARYVSGSRIHRRPGCRPCPNTPLTCPSPGTSIHSRAARRATSPSIDTDKSLKQARAPQESVDRRPAVLAAHHASGVSKKAKSGRKAVLSSRARRRQEKSMDRAEAIMDRTAVKVQRSKGHARVIHSRKKTWDEVNKEVSGDGGDKPRLSKKAKAKEEEDAMVAAFYSDDDGDAEMEGAGTTPAPFASLPVEAADEEEEEIL